MPSPHRVLPPWQTPATHRSAVVHALPSSQSVPLGLGGVEHTPESGLHVPASWHWSCAVHTTGFAPEHTPPWHVSVCVHAFPSVHAVPFPLAGFEHAPVAGLQVPASWHWSGAVHATGFAPVHAPPWHVSVRVHAFPS